MSRLTKLIVVGCFAVTMLLFPIEKTVALNGMNLNSYHSYPMPNSKPDQCSSSLEVSNEAYLNKKQAAAAALGLYFGIKHATAPHLNKQKMVPYICL
jgi:hypothetical protein